MSEIVNFPPRPKSAARRRRIEEEERAARERVSAEKKRREDRRLQLLHARQACEGRSKMKKASERRLVASNLWALLDRLEAGSMQITKAQVLLAAQKAREGDSTKHLERYALRPGLNAVEEEKRTRKLTQDVRKYIAIARKAAELAGSDPDEAELEVLHGSAYLSPSTALPPPEHPDTMAADTLAEGLRRIARRLDERYGLSHYFKAIERHRIVPRATPEQDTEFVASGLKSLVALTSPHPENDFPVIACCPSVYLGTVIVAPPVARTAHILVNSHPEPSGDPWLSTLDVNCIPTWDVYLALMPSAKSTAASPTLLIKPIIRIKPEREQLIGPEEDGPTWFRGGITLGEVAFSSSEIGRLAEAISREDFFAVAETRVEPIRLMASTADPTYWLEEYGLEFESHFYDFLEMICVSASAPDTQETQEKGNSKIFSASATTMTADMSTILDVLTRPMFFRHHETDGGGPVSTAWTDERQDHRDLYFLPSIGQPPISTPTVATEGTLLARLERWMNGDLAFPEGADIMPGRLENELARRAEALVRASEAALQQARMRLDLLLADAPTEPSADAEPIPDQT